MVDGAERRTESGLRPRLHRLRERQRGKKKREGCKPHIDPTGKVIVMSSRSLLPHANGAAAPALAVPPKETVTKFSPEAAITDPTYSVPSLSFLAIAWPTARLLAATT